MRREEEDRKPHHPLYSLPSAEPWKSSVPWVSVDGETVETVSDFIFGGSKITADGDCSHEIWK